jgi:hypothetical protein
MLLSCIVFNKEETVHSYALMSFIAPHIEYVAVFKKGPIFGEFTQYRQKLIILN